MKNQNFYKTLPKKRMGTGVLLFNKKNELLIVKPTYKNYWSIPGGVIDINESPRVACIREIKEEIGLNIKKINFIGVDYVTSKEKGESLQFLFYGGILRPRQINKIKIPKDELNDYKFINASQVEKWLSGSLSKRIKKCLNFFHGLRGGIYLETKKG